VDIESLQVFIQVAEQGSLTKAAVILDSIQPAISRKIACLERQCGGRLFHRTGRGLTLTEFGRQILPRVKALLSDVTKLESEMKAGGGIPTGEVRLGILPSLSDPAVYTLFERVRERFPGVLLHVLEGSTGQIDEWLINGRIDIAIRFRYTAITGVNEQSLGTMDTYLVSAPGDKRTKSPTIKFAAIDGLPLVLPGFPNTLRVALDQLSRQNRVSLSVVMEADSLPIQKRMAALGHAYAILATYAIQNEVRAGSLQASRLVNPGLDRTIDLGTTIQRPLSLAAREVARLVRPIYEDLLAKTASQ
jgi:LysR family transcriptional regulator, nitrogen assimilation regulatory protein